LRKLLDFINYSTKRRLFFYFIFASLTPLIVVQVITSLISNDAVKNVVVSSTVTEVQANLSNLEKTFCNIEDICDNIINDASFQKRMRADYSTQEERFSEDLQGSMGLISIVGTRKEISGLYLLGENLLCCKSNTNSFRKGDYRNDIWFENALHNNESVWYGFNNGSLVTKTTGSRFISFCTPYVDKASGENNGVIMVDIDENVITSIINQEILDIGFFLLLDKNNEIMYKTENNVQTDALLDHVLSNINSGMDNKGYYAEAATTIVDQKALVVFQRSVATHWTLVGVVPSKYINQTLQYILLITVVTVLLMSILALFASSMLARNFTEPIIEMKTAMKSVEEGDLSVVLSPRGSDELADLANSFNHMVVHIRRLINSVYEKQVLLRKSEYKALQAQINPHFLYNSLDSIVWLLRMKRIQDAITILQSLTVLFRISLSKGYELIPIRSEIRHLESYLTIQSMRYNRKFSYTMKIDNNLLEYLTPKLVLQPLVENSIYHGLSSERPHIQIDISLCDLGEAIVFQVADNGVGISVEKLNQLIKDIDIKFPITVEHDSTSGGYGLRNVNGRIKTYFDDDYGLTIQSELHVGTTVMLTIPKTSGDKNYS
jgi:two-component system sensor histidine kinase YesM